MTPRRSRSISPRSRAAGSTRSARARGAAARGGGHGRRREVLRQSRSRRHRPRIRGPAHRRMNPKARQELLGIAALLVGLFLGLTLLPLALTGSWGRTLGGGLWQWFGVGAIAVPILGVAWALAAFDRLGALSWGRAAVLGTGLVVLIPYGIAVAIGGTFPAADYATWTRPERLAGFLPGLLAQGVHGAIGTAGAVLVGLFALSALGVFTIGWHPLTVLRQRDSGLGNRESGKPAAKRIVV